jgi:hypothetical protein
MPKSDCREELQLLFDAAESFVEPALGHHRPWAKAMDRARAALAQPEPVAPTLMEIVALADEVEKEGLGQIDLVRRALARWGRPSIKPIPMDERKPRPEDCDEDGCCWMYEPDGAWGEVLIDAPHIMPTLSHWLPCWALPVPTKPTREEN